MASRVLLRAGDAELELDPERGGRVAALRIGAHSLLVPENDDRLRWGCYPMAPWAGRLRRGRFRFEGRSHGLPVNLPPHAIHGTTFDRPWQLSQRSEREARLQIDLGPDWPFEGEARQVVSLDDGALTLELSVEARAGQFPASLGWHPWFLRDLGTGRPLELDFEAEAMYATDAEGIPTGERVAPSPRPWDDCFTRVARPPRLRWPGVLALGLEASSDHWVVYDQPEHAICVEPMTGPPDALNLAPRRVRPDDPLTATTRWTWRREDGV